MLNNIYNQTVTILNRLRRTGNVKTDLWYKTVIHDAAWYTAPARSAGNSTVYIGTYITVLIPYHSDYIPYKMWKLPNMQEDHFTISDGDYVILGEVTEDVTSDNIVEVVKTYGEEVCTVRHHNENYNRFGSRVQLKIQGV